MNLWLDEHFCPWSGKNGGQKCSTGQRFIFTEVTFYKIHILAVHDGKKPFEYDICDYCCFQVDIETHKKTWRNETS